MATMPDGTPYPVDPGDLADEFPGIPDDVLGDPGALYPGGNYPQTPYNSGGIGEGISDARCCEDKICNCLGSSLQGIEYALYAINATLGKKQKGICDNVDDCLDKIIEGINKKYKGIHHTCEECRAMVEQGLSGTLEFGLTCAACTMQECDTQCSLGDPSTEGKCCKGCGQEKCCCKDGACSPCEGKEEEKKKYQGWCNPETGLVAVTKEGDAPPGAGYVAISLADTEQVALEEANQYCSTYKKPEETPPAPPIPAGSPAPGCNIASYCSPGGTLSIFTSGDGARALGAGATIMQRIRSIGFGEVNIGTIADLARATFQGVYNDSDYLISQEYIPQIANLIGCGSPAFTEPAKILAAVGLAEKTSGTSFQEFTLPYRYAMHAACRQAQLSPDQAMSAYLANAIDYPTLDCHWAIAGYCPDALPPIVEAQRAKPVPLQLAFMLRRELIDEDDYRNGMRRLGYLKDSDTENLFKLTEQLPTMTDITRLMVRDADDETIPYWPQSDELFQQKYGGRLRKWSESQGIPEEFFKLYWRAHWNIPSPGQLFEFYHRLRRNPNYNLEGDLLEKIKGALIQQDILPFWHEYYLAVSFKPLGRVDIRRSYNLGTLSDQEMEDAYAQIGYSDDTVAKLSKFSKRLRDESAIGHKAVKLWLKFAIDRTEATQRMVDGGLPADVVNRALDDASIGFIACAYGGAFVKGDLDRTELTNTLENWGVGTGMAQRIADLLALKRVTHPAINDYLVGTVSRSTAWTEATQDGMNGDITDRLLDKADKALNQAQIVNCTKAIKRRYLLGEFTQQQANTELTTVGIDGGRANDLISWWQCEKVKLGKSVPAAKLCDWLARGAISPVDFLDRLHNIGYDQQAAQLMLDDCLISINVKRLAQARKEAKEQQAEATRAANAIRRQQAAVERIAAQQARAVASAAKIRQTRERQLLSAVSKMAAKCDCDLYDTRGYVRSARDNAMANYGLNVDEAMQAVLLAIEEWEGGNPDTLDPIVDGFAQEASQETSEAAT